ncbi:MAG: transposase [Spirochaetia bacterium]|nr:transposase [Spirochaetia bacterium]
MENLVQVDRQTPFLMPQDLKDWLPENHIIHFIIDAVEAVSANVSFHLNKRGSGSKQFNPEMMMELLIYSYCTKRFSSYAIEKATYTDIPTMYITAMEHPDHNTINNFRKNNREAFKKVFTQLLLLAQTTGLMKKIGTISVDGTKIHANASKHKAVSYKYAKEQIEKYEKEVDEILKEAEKIDNTENDVNLPEEIAVREKRISILKKTVKQIFEKLLERLPEEKSGETMSKEKMRTRLKTQEGQKIYSKRKTTVEPVFGIIKRVMGFRQFLMRGLENIGIEWDLVTISYNVSRMYALKNLSPTKM